MIKEFIRFVFIGGSLSPGDFSLKTSNSSDLRDHEKLKICRKACKKLGSESQELREEGERVLSDKALAREAVVAMRECLYRALKTETGRYGRIWRMINTCQQLATRDSLELLMVVAAEAKDEGIRDDAVGAIEQGYYSSNQEKRWPFPLEAGTSRLLCKIVYGCPHDKVSAIGAKLLGQSEDPDAIGVLLWAIDNLWNQRRQTVHAADAALTKLALSSNEKIRAAAAAPEVAKTLESYRKRCDAYREEIKREYGYHGISGGPVSGVG